MKKHKHPKKAKHPRHRNAAVPGAAPRRRSLPRRGEAPDLWTTIAAAAGGAGSALLGGLLINQKVLSPEVTAAGMILGGGATAYFADGRARVVGHSMASAGAGQLALSMLNRRAMKAPPRPEPVPLPAQVPPALPAPATVTSTRPAMPSNAAFGGSYVLDVFRDAAAQLDVLDEDPWRMDGRDAASMEADVYDLEDVAA